MDESEELDKISTINREMARLSSYQMMKNKRERPRNATTVVGCPLRQKVVKYTYLQLKTTQAYSNKT